MTSPDAPRTTRGGPYVIIPRHGRSAYRNFFGPGRAIKYIGFRVVHLPQEVVPPRMSLRGGFTDFTVWSCRSADRLRLQPDYANCDIGFRVVCLPREVTP